MKNDEVRSTNDESLPTALRQLPTELRMTACPAGAQRKRGMKNDYLRFTIQCRLVKQSYINA